MASILVLTAVTGAQLGKRLEAGGRSATIGSGSSNDIVLHDRTIAIRHAEIKQILDRWFIVPLVAGSSGISLNGLPISSQSRLNPGDQVTLGAITYRVSFAEEQARAVGAPAVSSSGVPRLGEYFIQRGIMTAEQVGKTARRQDELQHAGSPKPFGQVAYELGYINRTQLDAAVADQRSDFDTRFSG